MSVRLHHVAIQVVDLERALAFYGGVLGLPEVRRQPHAIWVDAGGVLLMLEHCEGVPGLPPWKSPHQGPHLVSLAIDKCEREAWRDKLVRAGHPIVAETAFTLYVRDPDGTRIGLSHYPD